MVAPTEMDNIQNELIHPTKGVTATALVAVAQNLTTGFLQLGTKTLHLGSNPSLGAMLEWAIASGTTLTVRLKVSNDNVNFQYAPSIGVPSSGTSAVDIAEMTYSSATFDVGGSVSRCPVEALLSRWRYCQIWIKSNNASGTISGTAAAGTVG